MTLLTQTLEASAFVEVVDLALEVLEDERLVFLTGSFERIESIVERKRTILANLEALMSAVPRNEQSVDALRRLIKASRRNEQIIQAARQGLSHAKRRIAIIRDAARGVVAYAEDGSRIASRDDLIGSGKSA